MTHEKDTEFAWVLGMIDREEELGPIVPGGAVGGPRPRTLSSSAPGPIPAYLVVYSCPDFLFEVDIFSEYPIDPLDGRYEKQLLVAEARGRSFAEAKAQLLAMIDARSGSDIALLRLFDRS